MKVLAVFSSVWLFTLTVWSAAPAPATPTTLFHEDFNGYTNFPNVLSWGDRVNPGIPEISEGASQFWYGLRFSTQNGGTINSDLAVLRMTDPDPVLNNNPVGWFEDGAGIALRIDTTGYQNVNLSFDWRTVFASGHDRFVVGYHVGDDLGLDTSANRFRDLRTGPGAWNNGWVELMSSMPNNTFRSEDFLLPDNAGPVYVAFWLCGGEGDFGKLDNIVITGVLIPEPTTFNLVLVGLTALMVGRKRSVVN